MLKRLSVKNFAIITEINLEFYEGMTVLTGQTGAGKSLIIDSINLLLGSRADLDMIRYNEKEAYILGCFEMTDDIKKLGYEGSELIIERTISKKNQIKINGLTATLSELKILAKVLADVHTQLDTIKLINPDTYINLIDNFVNIDKSNYLTNLFSYKEALKKYKETLNKKTNLNERLDLIKFQYEELSNYELKENELEELIIKEDKLKNFDKIYRNLTGALNLINNEYFSIDNLYDASNMLKQIEEYDIDYKAYKTILKNSYYELEDLLSNLNKTIKNLDFNPEELEIISSRVNELKTLEKKYNKSINELIKYVNDLKYELDLQLNYDDLINELKLDLENKFNKTLNEAKIISDLRKKGAKKIEDLLIKECLDLDLANVLFEISFREVELNYLTDQFLEDGIDTVDFLISLNKGEPVKPLHKVASGGELSRIMLGLKCILLSNCSLQLMVFDEIDTGISGKTTKMIAKKIKEISKKTQVLAITHQASVAGIADRQLHVKKETIDERTKTNAFYLSKDERIQEIALMLSGSLSIASLEGAKELLG